MPVLAMRPVFMVRPVLLGGMRSMVRVIVIGVMLVRMRHGLGNP